MATTVPRFPPSPNAAGPASVMAARAAHPEAVQSGDRLIPWAVAACEREGLAPSPEALRARIAARLGLADPMAVTLTSLEGPGPPATGGTPDADQIQQCIARLARDILGAKERAVFVARYRPDGRAPVSIATLARETRLPPARIARLEASAKRKIATALDTLGVPWSHRRP